jgi:hypothetical protein
MDSSRFEMRGDGIMVPKPVKTLRLRIKDPATGAAAEAISTSRAALIDLADQMAPLGYEMESLAPL